MVGKAAGILAAALEPTREQAWETLTRYTKSEALLRHALAVEASTASYARRFGEDEELWRVTALLHDFDYEIHPTLDKHPQDGAPILREEGYPEIVIEAVLSHAEHLAMPRDTLLKKTLFACDELSGFVHACGLVRPTGLDGLEPKSVRKKLKQPSFAAGVHRDEVYAGAELLGLELDEHIANVVAALQPIAPRARAAHRRRRLSSFGRRQPLAVDASDPVSQRSAARRLPALVARASPSGRPRSRRLGRRLGRTLDGRRRGWRSRRRRGWRRRRLFRLAADLELDRRVIREQLARRRRGRRRTTHGRPTEPRRARGCGRCAGQSRSTRSSGRVVSSRSVSDSSSVVLKSPARITTSSISDARSTKLTARRSSAFARRRSAGWLVACRFAIEHPPAVAELDLREVADAPFALPPARILGREPELCRLLLAERRSCSA